MRLSITAAMLIGVTTISCEKQSASKRSAATASSIKITTPASSPYKTSAESLLVAGECSASVTGLTVSRGKLLDANCADGSFALEPIILNSGSFTLTVSGRSSDGGIVSASVVIETQSNEILAIVNPQGERIYTATQDVEISGQCRGDVASITASMGTVDTDCAANGVFKLSATLPNQENDYRLVLTANYGETNYFELKRTLTYDKTPPVLAITTPASNYFGRGVGVSVSGTCASDVTKLTSNIALSDSDCSDGSWTAAPVTIGWEKKVVSITGIDASGNGVSASITLTKALSLGAEGVAADGVRLDPDAAVWTDGSRMLIAEPASNRVLVFSSMPLTATQPPDFVLGQVSWLSKDVNAGEGLTARSLNTPRSVYFDGQRIIVADTGNHRVLIWNAWPTQNFANANVVVGAPTASHLNATSDPVSASNLNTPVHAAVEGSSLWVVDQGNHRVLRWSTVPSATGTAADLVVGQVDLISRVAASGGISAQSLNSPSYVTFGGGKMAIADLNHHRVLIWNSIPSSNNAAADVVVGQPDFATTLAHHSALSARSLRSPKAAHIAGTTLLVSDNFGRILGWNTVPVASFSAADFVLGQSATTNLAYNAGGISASTLHTPGSMSSSGSKLYVSDMGNARILGYDLSGLSTGASANFLYGALDYSTYVREVYGGLAFSGPQGVAIGLAPNAVGKYFIADTNNNRVLIYNRAPVTNGDAPDVILGQPTDGVGSANNAFDPLNPTALSLAAASSRNFNGPRAVMTDGYRLYVADTGNHRVLVWNSIPTTNFAPADLVLGQPDFLGNTANNPGLAAQGQRLSSPGGVFALTSDGTTANTMFLVADTNNSRVLIWTTLPTSNGTIATRVVGQANLNGVAASNASAAVLRSPEDMWTNGTKLAIADSGNHRVLLYDNFPGSDGVTATTVVGQPANNTNTANHLGRAGNTLSGPMGVSSIGGNNLYIADSNNNRVLYYSSWPSGTKPSASTVIPQPDFSAGGTGVVSYGIKNFGLNSPRRISVASDGRIMVSSLLENAVKIWNSVPALPASPNEGIWLGQRTMVDAAAKELNRFEFFTDVLQVGGKLFAIDGGRNLIAGWNSIPDNDAVPPDFLLGQVTLDRLLPNGGGTPTQGTFFSPQELASDGTNLVVSDQENHRVLIYNTLPNSSAALPDVVVGQPNFTSYGANYGGISAATLNIPRGVEIINGRLVVGDAGNNRVLIWNSVPTSNGAAADIVLGQPNFTTNALNVSLNAKSIFVPGAIASDGQNLVVTDIFSMRALIWNVFPTGNFAAADLVLGQPNFSSGGMRPSGINAQAISRPRGLYYASGILGVSAIFGALPISSSTSDLRILFWRGMPTQTNQPADLVWGQAGMDVIDGRSAPDRCVDRSSGLSFTNERLYVPCGGNIMIQPAPGP